MRTILIAALAFMATAASADETWVPQAQVSEADFFFIMDKMSPFLDKVHGIETDPAEPVIQESEAVPDLSTLEAQIRYMEEALKPASGRRWMALEE